MADFSFVSRLPETITTERLVLRAPNHDHVAAMARLANSKDIYKWLSRLPHPYTKDDAIDFIDNLARSEDEHAYAIETRDGDFIGTVGLHPMHDEIEIGYWVGEPYWGEGYASEATRALADAAEAAGCADLRASAQSANIASLRVLEKCGFVKTHEQTGDCGPHKGVAITYLRRERSA